MTSIEVRAPYPGEDLVTVQVLDVDGELLECDHAGAESEEMEFMAYSWWDDAHTYVPDDSRTEMVLVCDKANCRAWYDDLNNEWRND